MSGKFWTREVRERQVLYDLSYMWNRKTEGKMGTSRDLGWRIGKMHLRVHTCNFQKTKIMASGSITSWEIDGETMETVTDFILGGSQITAYSDCSPEIKRCLLLGRKVMTNLDSILYLLLRAGIPQKKWSSHHGQQKSEMQYLDAISKMKE